MDVAAAEEFWNNRQAKRAKAAVFKSGQKVKVISVNNWNEANAESYLGQTGVVTDEHDRASDGFVEVWMDDADDLPYDIMLFLPEEIEVI